MRLAEDVVEYFKGMADEAGVPYQSRIHLYLRDCLAHNRKVKCKSSGRQLSNWWFNADKIASQFCRLT